MHATVKPVCAAEAAGLRRKALSRRKLNPFTQVGMLALAAGLVLRTWMHFRYSEFAAGFLIGLALVFMIFGLIQQQRMMSN